MRANLTVISSVFLAVLLFCLGCEPEPQTTPAEPVQQTMESSDMALEAAEQPEPQQAEPPVPQQEEPSRQEIEQAQAELEMMMKQAKAEQTAPQQQAQPEPDFPEVEPQIAPEPQLPSPDDVIVTVNGEPVARGRVDELVDLRLEQVTRRARKQPPEEYLANIRKQYTQQVIEGMIIQTLIDQQMKKNNIIVSEQDIEDYIAKMAARENMTIDDFKEALADSGRDYEEWKKRMQFDKIVGALQLAQIEGFGTVDVNEADAREYYQQNENRYAVPEQVRASHILITPEQGPDMDPNQADAAALQKTQQLLEQIKQGADFAQLAMENSACPSAAKGGDLGFARRQSWVAPFSDAAFALQTGQVSDVVKTQFGYHIIKVTDRKEASVIPFDIAKDEIFTEMQARREADIVSKYIASLRENANIVYAEEQSPEKPGEGRP